MDSASSTFSVTGTWSDEEHIAVESLLPIGQRREMDITMGSRRFAGVEWWAVRNQFTACITWWDPATNAMSFSIISDVVIVRAEWWRRLGYALVRHLPERPTDGA